MYAAAGGASLASRRHKHKHRNTADADALIHQQFQRRFQQHQQQYAPASVEHHLRASSSLTPSTPMSPFGQVRLPSPFDPAAENKSVASVAWPGPVPIEPSPDSDSTAPGGSILIHLPADPHRKWTKKNKIHDALSFGDGAERRLYELQQGAIANALLYVGLCSVALGLIIAFVGTGEKGFKTVQLRFIGPGMIALGVCCCAVRILLCFCPPTTCFKRRRHKDGGATDKMAAEFYKYMPFRNHPLNAPGTQHPSSGGGTGTGTVVMETVPMTVLKPALKRVSMAADQQVIRMPKATPEASLDSSLEHLIEQDDHLYTKDEVSSNRNLSNLKSTLTFESSLNVATTEMMVKSFEELNNTTTTSSSAPEPFGPVAANQPTELVLSAMNLTK